MTLASDWGVGEVVLTMLWFTCFFIWIWLLISVFVDIFRSHDMGGFAKVLWIIFVFFLPFLGVFVYLIARGGKMQQHNVEAMKAQDAAMKDYIRQAAGTGAAEEVERLHGLLEKGAITQAEYDAWIAAGGPSANAAGFATLRMTTSHVADATPAISRFNRITM